MQYYEQNEWESAQELAGEAYEGEYEAEYEAEYEGEYEGEFFTAELAHEQLEQGEYGELFSEALETELALELLEVSNEAELDRFLGNLLQRGRQALGQAGAAISAAARSPTGQAVGGMLKGVAKAALPMAGGAASGYLGGPLGAKIGAGIGSGLAGLIKEGETGEASELEFRGAQRFVRIGGDLMRRVAYQRPHGDPRRFARHQAVRRYAPLLLQPRRQHGYDNGYDAGYGGGYGAAYGGGEAPRGRWVRRGNRVILLGV